jgi:hypothetical protein
LGNSAATGIPEIWADSRRILGGFWINLADFRRIWAESGGLLGIFQVDSL